MKARRLGLVVLVYCCVAWVSAFAGDEITVKGLVTERTADNLTLRTSDGSTTAVLLTDYTKVQVPKGLGLRKRKASWAEIIPGLRVEVKGMNNPEGKLEAKQITFKKTDLETASMIQAGLNPTEQKVSANQQAIAANVTKIDENEAAVNQRFKELTDFDVKKSLVVNFAVGSSKLSAKDKASLSALAASTKDLQGYLIQVQGYADSSGNPAFNQTLSRDRAEAVIDYLMQEGNITPRHIMAPGAMGVSSPTASNETAAGRAENRRVEVKLLMNKGLQNRS